VNLPIALGSILYCSRIAGEGCTTVIPNCHGSVCLPTVSQLSSLPSKAISVSPLRIISILDHMS
jgi:hypothetical protein